MLTVPFLTKVIGFLIIAFVVFLIVKQVNRRREVEAALPQRLPLPACRQYSLAPIAVPDVARS